MGELITYITWTVGQSPVLNVLKGETIAAHEAIKTEVMNMNTTTETLAKL